jgi:RNA polymerase sigma-70 factor (ECF subfamily)
LKVNLNRHWCERIYDAKAAELVLYGRALGLCHGEAEDVLQETFMALMQMEVQPEQPENYCVRSFRNRALNHRRSLWRRLTREWEVLADGLHWFEKTPEQSPEEAALQAATVRKLQELPMEQREVIVLKIWHGCTFDEIGGLLEVSPNTAAGRYRYGIQKLKSKLVADVRSHADEPWKGENYERAGRESIAGLATAPGVSGA